jgi:hypothetical protein
MWETGSQCLLILKKPIQQRQYFKSSNWCDLAKEIFKRFLNSQNIEYLTKKNVTGLKFCIELDISTADESLIK